MNFFAKIGGMLFGGKSDKGLVEQAADAVERFAPGVVKQHEMAIEDIKSGDESQKNAQQLQLAGHTTLFDVFVDGINRLIRPLFSIWVFLVLANQLSTEHLAGIPPMAWNIIWTVIGFWFGTRMVFKDIPALINTLKGK